MTTVVLADDHLIFDKVCGRCWRKSLTCRWSARPATVWQPFQLVERLQPDVLVLDLTMPGLNGHEVAQQVSQQVPSTRIVVLSMHANEAYVLQALKCGAAGYVLKGSGMTELVQAIREVAQGRHYLSPPLSERAIELYMQKAQETPLDLYETLTPRERQYCTWQLRASTTPKSATGFLSAHARPSRTEPTQCASSACATRLTSSAMHSAVALYPWMINGAICRASTRLAIRKNRCPNSSAICAPLVWMQ